MATFRKRASGWHQAIVRRKGYPEQSKTFETREEAEKWARAIESEIDRGVFVSRAEAERTTFKTAAERYEREILPSKRSAKQDSYRLKALVTVFGKYSLAAITSSQIAGFRDDRLKSVSPQSVVHEINMLSRVFRAATMDWGIALPGGIPTATVRKPSVNNERTRRLVEDEESRLLAAIEDPGPSPGERRNVWIKPLVQLAIETAARQSELLSLDWKDVDLERRVIRLRGAGGRETKNSDAYRDVPLSTAAVSVLAALQKRDVSGKVVKLARGGVFSTTAAAVKKSWERAVARARDRYERETVMAQLLAAGLPEATATAEVRKVKPLGGPKSKRQPLKRTLEILSSLAHDPRLADLHFHDLRHEATSRLAEKLQMHELMKVTGHKGTRMLARYYHPRAEDLAKKLG